jgi:Bacterial toxin 33
MVELSALSDGCARHRGDRVGVDRSAEGMAITRMDASCFLPGPQPRGTGGTLNAMRILSRSGPPAPKLKQRGIDPEMLKEETGTTRSSHSDLYKLPNGDIVVKGKGGIGPGEPTGININEL